jgi:hypothetical protein
MKTRSKTRSSARRSEVDKKHKEEPSTWIRETLEEWLPVRTFSRFRLVSFSKKRAEARAAARKAKAASKKPVKIGWFRYFSIELAVKFKDGRNLVWIQHKWVPIPAPKRPRRNKRALW